ncbi:MAG: heavy metal translocating P-type ATPase metal-binding domain-containing protein [Chitinophagaceae bacterium]|nr:heavy metal translocating P-type ATPase metal-binding domain-containing protein [Chitinophagaceae bacterium]MCB9047433.1 heavy metal translocating P-type ATPase metal-binding domain-containing protein [Chitinophagales bacterium]
MPDTLQQKNTLIIKKEVQPSEKICYHCGTECATDKIAIDDKLFCCEGCKLVYKIINENGLCNYYELQNHPGLSQIKPIRNDKYAYLDDESIAQKLYQFTDGNNTIVNFYLPGVHCSSCMWLLEHMHKLNPAITDSRVNFTKKEITITFRKEEISLRKVVELLTTLGYEPLISLEETSKEGKSSFDKKRIYKLGVAGFCFGNIMLMSFPEYLSVGSDIEQQYASLFRVLNLVLAMPVFFYSASEFFTNAWAGLRQKMLNIDAPIALALIITFARSVYEIGTQTGAGYLDSMTGVVFFMLVGRIVQDRTYQSISFHRDYKSYFPIAVNVVTPSGVVSKHLQDLKVKDVVQLHNDEIIPADAIVVKGRGQIDYSFVTGESEPITVEAGKTVYAGGRQTGEQLTIQITKPVAGSYLTSLWNHNAFKKDKVAQNRTNSVIHLLSKYFTIILLVLTGITAAYWAIADASKLIPAVTAMLIIACPCALLLAVTFTNGNLLRLLSNNGLFLRDAFVIEQLGYIDHIVFDKTGTLTDGGHEYILTGDELTEEEKDAVYATAVSSSHPYSRAIVAHIGTRQTLPLQDWKEHVGRGVEAHSNKYDVLIGSAVFTMCPAELQNEKAACYIRINGKYAALAIEPKLRPHIPLVISKLKDNYSLSLLSGDNNRQKDSFSALFGQSNNLLFEQKPVDKLNYISGLQSEGKKVLMVGDGLNDAGALQQSNVGITLASDVNNFTPSCDAILNAKKFDSLPGLMKLARSGRFIINLTFVISIIYNVIGLAISMKGLMNPMIAAVLMPASTLTIVLLTTGLSSVMAYRYGLQQKG